MGATDIPIYSITYPGRIPDGAFRALMQRVPGAMAEQIGRYRRWEDAYGSLLGKVLLMTALAEAGSSATLDELRYNAFSRPYLEKGPDFNISHSGNRVACVLGKTGRVGLDLEEIRPLAIQDFRGQFTAVEWAAITGAPEPMRVFYHYWTAKESIIKADGRGLNIPLDQLVIDHATSIDLAEQHWKILRIDAWEGYVCHLATESVSLPVIKEISLEDIL